MRSSSVEGVGFLYVVLCVTQGVSSFEDHKFHRSKMFQPIVLLLTISTLLPAALSKEVSKQNEKLAIDERPYFYLIEQSLDDQSTAAGTLNEGKVKAPSQPQQVYQPRGYGGFRDLEPQFPQYPVYNQQAFPRLQPSIFFYGAGGQGQPILINPGSPPGNFLVPQQPGTNVFLRGNPQTPIFVSGYPNPKPAHIPPIEKDAEEIPTDPSSIPPLPTSNSKDKKPEKIETFNEDNLQPKTAGEAEVLAEADKNVQPITGNIKPGQRFFILNGEPLYQNYPTNYLQDPNLAFQQIDHPYQQIQDGQRQQEFNYNVPQNLLLRIIPNFNEQQFNAIPVQNSDSQQNGPIQNNPQYTQGFIPLNQYNIPQQTSLRENLPELLPVNQQNIPQQGTLFRTNLQGSDENKLPVGQFRYNPPNEAYIPFGDDPDNDSIVVNANFEDGVNDNQEANEPDAALPTTKTSEASTAQAAPGAIALAGPGGIAGASPKATALVGKGGLAVSSPKATAIAGTKDDDKETKNKIEEKKPTKKTKN